MLSCSTVDVRLLETRWITRRKAEISNNDISFENSIEILTAIWIRSSEISTEAFDFQSGLLLLLKSQSKLRNK